MSVALSPGNDQPHSAIAQESPDQTAGSIWSEGECLFISLQADLALAAASLPIASALPLNGSTNYQNFRQFFEKVAEGSPEAALEQNTSVLSKSKSEYRLKQEESVGSVLSKTQKLMLNARGAGRSKQLKWWEVTPAVFYEYRKIRKMIGYDTEVQDPRDNSEMWAFLDRIIREKFPDSCTVETTSANADKSNISSGVVANDITADSLAPDGTGRNDAHVTIDAALASDDPPVVGTTRPGTTTISESSQIADVNVAPSQALEPEQKSSVVGKPEKRLGPDDFAKETGPITCTMYCKNGRRCALRAPEETPEEKRPSYICHVHRSANSKALNAEVKELKRKKMALDHEVEDDNADEIKPLRKRPKVMHKHETPSDGADMLALDERSDVEGEDEGGEEEEQGEEEDEGHEDNSNDKEQEAEVEPIKKRTESGQKPKGRKRGGHSANRAANDAWNSEERQILVDVFNNRIENHGLVSWQDDFTKLLEEARALINEYRTRDPVRYAGDRSIHGVRSQVTKKRPIQSARAEADRFRTRIAGGEKIGDAELKPRDFFKLADITPASRQKK